MKKLFLPLFLIMVWGLWAPISVYAESSGVRSAKVTELNQKVYVNKDSSVDYIETTTFKLTGTFHTFSTKFPLYNRTTAALCEADVTKQCVFPSVFTITDVQDLEGNPINPSKYLITEETDSDGSVFKVFEYFFSDEGEIFNNETFGIKLKYTVLGLVGHDASQDIDYIYMSNVPIYNIEADSIVIQNYFPEGFTFNPDLFRVYQPLSGSTIDYTRQYFASERMVEIKLEGFMMDKDFTYQIGFPTGIVDLPANLRIEKSTPSNLVVSFDGISLDTGAGDVIQGVPTGKNDYSFSARGYVDKTISIDIASGETKSITIELEETFFTRFMRITSYILNGIGIILIPTFLVLIYKHWSHKGRDASKVRVIVPFYHPPENIRPYLMGSVKDEKVDVIDITSTLIDVAYRGFIKIKELPGTKIFGIDLGGKDYELTKEKAFDDLSENEKLIMNGIFDFKERTTISDLQNKFYTHIPSIQSGIYKEMKDIGYFASRPDETRRNYLLLGFGVLILGGMLFFFNGFVETIFIFPLFLTISIAVGLAGLAFLIAAPFMPARTVHGSKVYEQLLGFKMYMEVAERFRVQDLTPETFEKFLPYAMVFGIEKKWGERFKDICKEPPSWFQGSTNAWNTIYMVNALSSFNTSTVHALTSVPSSSRTGTGWGSRGGGWVGGGGFSGGFSGGGFGGGRSGGFT